jgi:N-acetylglutamate synthase-like GNAT family acetyltransferase
MATAFRRACLQLSHKALRETVMLLTHDCQQIQLDHSRPLVVIRAATLTDVRPLTDLVAEHVQRGQLLPRSVSDIRASLMTWTVAEVDSELVGCASLRRTHPARMEVRSLAVRAAYRGQGLGAALVRALVVQAWHAEATTVYALTRAVPFFERLGFEVTDLANLPEKNTGDCACCPLRYTCDETAVWLHRR